MDKKEARIERPRWRRRILKNRVMNGTGEVRKECVRQ